MISWLLTNLAGGSLTPLLFSCAAHHKSWLLLNARVDSVVVVSFAHMVIDWHMCMHFPRLALMEGTDIIRFAMFRPSVIFKYLVYY